MLSSFIVLLSLDDFSHSIARASEQDRSRRPWARAEITHSWLHYSVDIWRDKQNVLVYTIPESILNFCQSNLRSLGAQISQQKLNFWKSFQKPFECTICHEKFTRMENRTRHMAIHTGERRFNCDVCGKGFSQVRKIVLSYGSKAIANISNPSVKPLECASENP